MYSVGAWSVLALSFGGAVGVAHSDGTARTHKISDVA